MNKKLSNEYKEQQQGYPFKSVVLNDCQKVLYQQKLMTLNECIEYAKQLKKKKQKV